MEVMEEELELEAGHGKLVAAGQRIGNWMELEDHPWLERRMLEIGI